MVFGQNWRDVSLFYGSLQGYAGRLHRLLPQGRPPAVHRTRRCADGPGALVDARHQPADLAGRGPWKSSNTTPASYLRRRRYGPSASATAVVGLACYSSLRRTRTLRAWAMLAAYAVASRSCSAPAPGRSTARYPASSSATSPTWCTLQRSPSGWPSCRSEAPSSPRERTPPLLVLACAWWLATAACVAVQREVLVSTVGYVGFWRTTTRPPPSSSACVPTSNDRPGRPRPAEVPRHHDARLHVTNEPERRLRRPPRPAGGLPRAATGSDHRQ